MSILFSHTLSSFSLSLKLILISTGVLSAAVAVKLSVPALADFVATDVPSIYNCVVSWLRPPYLYLVINCIIITIVASSKFQSKVDDEIAPSVSPPPLETTTARVHPQPVVLPPEQIKQHSFDSFVMKREAVEAVTPEVFQYPTNSINTDLNVYEDKELGTDKEFINASGVDAATEIEMNSYVDYPAISKSSRSPTTTSRRDSSEYSLSNDRPPASARFGHRRAVKASPEAGGKAAALGVSKSKRQDTLESTWKTITEGRAMPLTRHLRKSDTWETHGGRHHSQTPQNQKMTKSETFQDHSNGNRANATLSPSPGGSGKLKREPSLSQDELNRRVEAFIKKFNEEMRLQRQESLNQYMEMINRGAH